MEVIDIRVRVPYKSFKHAAVFADPSAMDAWAKKFGVARPKQLGTMEQVLADLDAAGVSLACVSGRRGHNVENKDIAEMCAQYGQRLLGFPEIDPNDGVDYGLKEIEDYVINGPCHGVAVEPGFNRRGALYANDERFYFIYEKCQQHHLPLYLNFGGFIGPDHSFCDPRLIADVAKTFPDLKILLAHAAYPYALEACHLAMSHENVYLGTDMYAFRIPGGDIYIQAANSLIGDKIVFGSAYPIFDIQSAKEYYLQCGIKEGVLPQVMAGNAARFLGIA